VPSRSRRFVLATAASALVATAGCQVFSSGGSGGFDPSVFSASASVDQPTADRPPTVELSLTNTGERAWPVHGADHDGYPMEGVLAWPDSRPPFVWIPPESEHVNLGEHSDSRREGCWRLPESAEPAVADIRTSRTIEPGETFTVTHDVFFDGPPDACFPPGEYEVEASFAVAETNEDGPEFGVTYRLTIDEVGTFSMAADEPAAEN